VLLLKGTVINSTDDLQVIYMPAGGQQVLSCSGKKWNRVGFPPVLAAIEDVLLPSHPIMDIVSTSSFSPFSYASASSVSPYP
jgi:hypothetical protein